MSKKDRFLLLILTLAVILVDQFSKMVIARLLPFARPVPVIGDFLRLTYVKNPAIAFSIGRNFPPLGRQFIALVLPLLVLGILFYYYFFTRDISRAQRWVLAAIIGGGMGKAVQRRSIPVGFGDIGILLVEFVIDEAAVS